MNDSLSPREFVALIHEYQDKPGSREASQAFSTLWETVRPIIEEMVRRTGTLGPYAAIESYRQDCTRDVAVQFFDALPRFRKYWIECLEKGRTLPPLVPWLRTVVRNKAIDWARKQSGAIRPRSPGESYQNRLESLDERRDVGELLERVVGAEQVDVVECLRVGEILTWARHNLPADERLALLAHLEGEKQDKLTRRALEKLRRQFRQADDQGEKSDE